MAEKVKLETGVVTLAFPYLFEKDEDGKYRCAIFFPKSDKANATKIASAIKQAKKNLFGEEKIEDFKSPLIDGNKKDLEKYPFFKDCYIMNASSTFDITVLDPKGNTLTADRADDIYTGCKCRLMVSLGAYTHTKTKTKGVKAYLPAVMVGGGKRLIEKPTISFSSSEGLEDLSNNKEAAMESTFCNADELDDLLSQV